MKLGSKVTSNGYLKKAKTKYVFLNEEHLNDFLKKNDELPTNYILMNDDDFVKQPLVEFKEEKIEGLVVGKKTVYTSCGYYPRERDVFSGEDFVGTEVVNGVEPVYMDLVECYLVYYRMNRCALVPLENIKLLEV